MISDLRFAWRTLTKSPAFAAIAILAGVTLLLGGTALGACLLPARRAALVDPVRALRTE